MNRALLCCTVLFTMIGCQAPEAGKAPAKAEPAKMDPVKLEAKPVNPHGNPHAVNPHGAPPVTAKGPVNPTEVKVSGGRAGRGDRRAGAVGADGVDAQAGVEPDAAGGVRAGRGRAAR
jgi:hypothetical protein